MEKFSGIEYKEAKYINNAQNGYFEKQPQRIPFAKLPFDLKVETTHLESIKRNGAKEVLRGRTVKGNYTFFTGLQPTDFKNWYLGNDYKKVNNVKTNSLVIVHFTEDNSQMELYYFNQFYKFGKVDRLRFVNQFIAHKKGGL